MASSLALKKLVSSNLLPYSLRHTTRRAIPSIRSASKLFSTNAVPRSPTQMASSLALKRLVSSNLLPKYSLRCATRQAIPSTHSASRLFYTNTLAAEDIYIDDHKLPTINRAIYREPLSGLYDYPNSGVGAKKNNLWDAEETDDTLYLWMDIPGLEKEDVKVIVEQKTMIVKDETIVEQNTVIVKGETKEKSGEKDSGRRYTNKIDLPSKLYKTNQMKVEMKNGVLKVVVPKVKEEERSDLFHVKVE